MAQKRSLPAKVAAMRARKKQKLGQPLAASSQSLATERKLLHRSKADVGLDELDWRAVELPDGMDDYGGFYGLQEIDGVDVVRAGDGEASGSTVRFAVPEGSASKAKSSGRPKAWEDFEDPFPAVVDESEQEAEEQDSDVSEDDWAGLSDDDGADSPGLSSGDSPPHDNGHVQSETSSRDEEEDELDEGNGLNSDDDEDEDEGEKVTTPAPKSSKKKQKPDLDSALQTGSFTALLDQDPDDDQDLDLSAWKSLRLAPKVLGALEKLKFNKPTPIQAQSIPVIMSGEDLVGKAPTGSGKTLAFGIPILEHWMSEVRPKLKQQSQPKAKSQQQQHQQERSHTALILLPARELAHQIEQHLSALFTGADDQVPQIATLTGGLSIIKQRRLLEKADVVIATPGRLWELISESKNVLGPLQRISFLVIDEADRLLSDGHFKELTQILDALDRKTYSEDEIAAPSNRPAANQDRQTLVFSATFAKDLQQKLSKQNRSRGSDSSKDNMEYLLKKLNFRSPKPKFVDVQPESQMAAGLREGILECANGMDKDLYLYTMTLYYPSARTLVFVNSISAVRRLVPFLTNLNVNALPLHSQMVQKARLRSVERFSGQDKAWTGSRPKENGAGVVLVATDVAARGLDIAGVELVVHYNVPRAADTYVHRSGRTARAERRGSSVLICAPDEAAGVRRLVARVHVAASGGKRHALHSLELDRRLATRLKPRVGLAKTLADAEMAKEKQRGEDRALREAADELGVALGSDDEENDSAAAPTAGRAKGRQRRAREQQSRDLSKAELRMLRAELRQLLSQRVNAGGVSERYVAGGGVDVNALLRERQAGGNGLLGTLPPLGFED